MQSSIEKIATVLAAPLMLVVFAGGCATKPFHSEIVAYDESMTAVDEYTLAADKHLVRDYSPVEPGGHVNVVIEIPTGTNAKWEADKNTGELVWELKNGQPRVVSYLGYPGNYGMIPQTLLPQEMGGDGDPLDVIVLGPAIPRGSIVSVRPIGVLKLLDGGDQDDKIIAVSLDSMLGEITSIEDLQTEFNGITDIVEIWFSNYKGPSEIESNGYADVAASREVIDASIAAYRDSVL